MNPLVEYAVKELIDLTVDVAREQLDKPKQNTKAWEDHRDGLDKVAELGGYHD